MKKAIVFSLVLALAPAALFAQKDSKGKKGKGDKPAAAAVAMNKQDSLSYALGVSTAENLRKGGFTELNMDMFYKGLKEQQAKAACIPTADADKLVSDEMNRVANAKKEANKKDGEAFLEKNKANKDVVTLPSGLQYKIVKKGTGGAKPDGNDKVTVHYHGTLIDGTIFDSSVDRGKTATFGLNQVIPGWTEGLQYMEVGDKFLFYIPQGLAYGARAQGKILPFSTLIFEVELFNVEAVN